MLDEFSFAPIMVLTLINKVTQNFSAWKEQDCLFLNHLAELEVKMVIIEICNELSKYVKTVRVSC